LIFQVHGKKLMAKCTKCGADIRSTGYDTEELKLPNNTTGYLVSCNQCKTILGIVQEK
jgi:NAD-dependent SIR2 family protein deacetylase